MKLITQTILALGVIALLCTSCKEDDTPTPTPPSIDITGTWQIRTNDWHVHSSVERSGQDVFPGTITFDEYGEISGAGAFNYTVDGELNDETFAYQINLDTLRVLPNQLPENIESTYLAKSITDSQIILEGTKTTQDPNTGLLEVLTEELFLLK